MTDTINDVPRELLKTLLAGHLAIGHKAAKQELRNLLSAHSPAGDGGLDERMKAAGMLSAAELIAGAPLDAFMKHAGVNDLESFGKWLEMRRKECLQSQGRYDLGDRDKSDDLYEWTIAHAAVFGEVHVNFKAAMAGNQAIIDGLLDENKALRNRAKIAEREAGSALRTFKGLEKVARVVSDNSDQVCGELNVTRQQLNQLAELLQTIASRGLTPVLTEEELEQIQGALAGIRPDA